MKELLVDVFFSDGRLIDPQNWAEGKDIRSIRVVCQIGKRKLEMSADNPEEACKLVFFCIGQKSPLDWSLLYAWIEDRIAETGYAQHRVTRKYEGRGSKRQAYLSTLCIKKDERAHPTKIAK